MLFRLCNTNYAGQCIGVRMKAWSCSRCFQSQAPISRWQSRLVYFLQKVLSCIHGNLTSVETNGKDLQLICERKLAFYCRANGRTAAEMVVIQQVNRVKNLYHWSQWRNLTIYKYTFFFLLLFMFLLEGILLHQSRTGKYPHTCWNQAEGWTITSH